MQYHSRIQTAHTFRSSVPSEWTAQIGVCCPVVMHAYTPEEKRNRRRSFLGEGMAMAKKPPAAPGVAKQPSSLREEFEKNNLN